MGNVVDALAGCGDVPVDERDRAQPMVRTAVHGVSRRQVVVTDDLRVAGELGSRGQVVELPDQLRHPGESDLTAYLRWPVGWFPGHVTVDVGQDFAAGFVDAEEAGSGGPLVAFQVVQQAPDEAGPFGSRSPHGVADPDNGIDVAAWQRPGEQPSRRMGCCLSKYLGENDIERREAPPCRPSP